MIPGPPPGPFVKFWNPKTWIRWSIDRIRYRSPGSSDLARESLMALLDPENERIQDRHSVVALFNAVEMFCRTMKQTREFETLVRREREAIAAQKWDKFYRKIGLLDDLSLPSDPVGGDDFGGGPQLNPNVSRNLSRRTGEDMS